MAQPKRTVYLHLVHHDDRDALRSKLNRLGIAVVYDVGVDTTQMIDALNKSHMALIEWDPLDPACAQIAVAMWVRNRKVLIIADTDEGITLNGPGEIQIWSARAYPQICARLARMLNFSLRALWLAADRDWIDEQIEILVRKMP